MTGGASSTFSIDQSSAQIRLVTALDYETTTSYVIVVVATDGGGSVVRTFETNQMHTGFSRRLDNPVLPSHDQNEDVVQ